MQGQMRIMLIFIIIVVIGLVYAIVCLLRRMQKYNGENLELVKRYKELLSENNEMKKTLETNASENVRRVTLMMDRCKLLDVLISDYINNNGQIGIHASKAISRTIGDRNNFLFSLKLYFELLYPKFRNLLKERGLDEREIMISYLYCIGLSGKGILNYVESPNHYNECVAIRAKFGLTEHNTNIGPYLRRLLAELYPESTAITSGS